MTSIKHSRCLFCSLQCPVAFETCLEEALALEYDAASGLNGKLCSKGNYLLELINHPLRLTEPQIAGKPVSRPVALKEISAALEKSGGSSAGLILDSDASEEDMLIAEAFMEKCMHGGMLAVYTATGGQADRALAEVRSDGQSASFSEIASAKCIIAVGDPFEIGPVIAGPVLEAKYNFGKNMVFTVISESQNRTSKFTPNLFHGPVRKTLAAFLGAITALRKNQSPSWINALQPFGDIPENLRALAASFVSVHGAVLVLETQDPVTAVLASLAVEAAGPDKWLVRVSSQGTTRETTVAGKHQTTVEDLSNAVTLGKLRTLMVLGPDIGRNPDYRRMLDQVHTLVAGAPFPNRTTGIAGIVLPTAVWLELEGTYAGTRLAPVVSPPGGALGYGAILGLIARAMGHMLEPRSGQMEIPAGKTREDAIIRFLGTLPEVIEKPFAAPRFQSTVTRSGDGAITDMMNWVTTQQAVEP